MNRPLTFVEMSETVSTTVGREVFLSQGKMDTALIENAIARGAKEIVVRCNDLEFSWRAFSEQFTVLQAAGGVVANGAGQILFIHRLDKWDLPKGKVESHEGFQEAAVREVEEECSIHGLNVKGHLMTTYHTYMLEGTPILKCTHWFIMNYSGQELPIPQTIEGITHAEWIAPDNWEKVLKNTYSSVLDVLNTYCNTATQ